MKFTIESLASNLGESAEILLAETPFKNWTFKKSFRDDLEGPIIHYVFDRRGFELRCDQDERINVIFLSLGEFRDFNLDIPVSASRSQVIECLGLRSKSGDKMIDPILGEYGAWDFFTRLGYSIHVEYALDADCVKRITLERRGAVL
jgi:hypothetical protein